MFSFGQCVPLFLLKWSCTPRPLLHPLEAPAAALVPSGCYTLALGSALLDWSFALRSGEALSLLLGVGPSVAVPCSGSSSLPFLPLAPSRHARGLAVTEWGGGGGLWSESCTLDSTADCTLVSSFLVFEALYLGRVCQGLVLPYAVITLTQWEGSVIQLL